MFLNRVAVALLVCLGCVGMYAADSSSAPKNKKNLVISSIPENVKLIIGETNEKNYVPRVKAIHALPATMPPDQIEACLEFLAKKIETQTLPDLQFNGLKNELVFVLMRQKKKPEALAMHLVKMYNDKSYDITWRDYCVQFFGKWYPQAPNNQGRKEMVNCLWNALKHERNSRIAGAASAQLCFLSRKFPEISKKDVVAASLEALDDPKCVNISKVAILQTCAILGEVKALPIARKIATEGKNPLMRASAIAAVGMLGDDKDLEFLKKLETSRDPRLHRPAQAAIQKITSRRNTKK